MSDHQDQTLSETIATLLREHPHSYVHGPLGLSKTIVATVREHDADEIERLRAAIKTADDASTIEINPSNYDHDDVCQLNNEMTEVISILRAALESPLCPSENQENDHVSD